MISEVTEAVTARPEQSVHLTLTVPEFAALYILHYRNGSGSPEGVRGDIEDGLQATLEKLHPDYAASIKKAASTIGRHREAQCAYGEVDRIATELRPS